MARPKAGTIETATAVTVPTATPQAPKGTVKSAHFKAGFDLVASRSSVGNKESDIYELDHGLLIVSKKTKRKVVVPFGNLKGYELL